MSHRRTTGAGRPRRRRRADSAGPRAARRSLQSVRALRLRWQQELAARGVDRERAVALDERFAAAFNRVVTGWPVVFDGTDFDPDANSKRMEALARRMEDLAASLLGAVPAEAALSPTTRLAAMLKEALATNTIGGKADGRAAGAPRWKTCGRRRGTGRVSVRLPTRHGGAHWPIAFRRAPANHRRRGKGRSGGSGVGARPGGPGGAGGSGRLEQESDLKNRAGRMGASLDSLPAVPVVPFFQPSCPTRPTRLTRPTRPTES